MSFSIASKKKLLFVIYSLGGGGAERVVVHLINHLDRDKYDIKLVIFERILDYQKDLHSFVKIICLEKESRWDFFKLIFRLRNIIRNYKPNAVISFLHYTNILTVLASMFLKREFRLIISERSYHRKYLPKTRLRYLRRLLMKLTYRRSDGIAAVSESIKRVLEKDFNINSKKIKTIYNPINIEEIRNKYQKDIEHPFFKGEDNQVIISAGRLVEVKRFDRLLRAFSFVRKKQEKVHLIILGKGELRKELEFLASQLDISKCLDFVGFKSNPYAWIAKSDIFVLSSDYEGFPNVIIEAMSCGTPVISTDCHSGPNEIITNGKNGILVPPGDEKTLAEAILTLLKDKNLMKKFSEEGRRRAQDFKIEKILPQYEALF